MLSKTAHDILNDADRIRRRDEWFARMTDLFDGRQDEDLSAGVADLVVVRRLALTHEREIHVHFLVVERTEVRHGEARHAVGGS